jgi:hypothetical protein
MATAVTTRSFDLPWTHGRSTSRPVSTPTVPSGRLPTHRGSADRVPAHGRIPTLIAGPAPTSRTSTVTDVCSRCACPILTAAGRPTQTNIDCSSPCRPRVRPAARLAIGCWPKGRSRTSTGSPSRRLGHRRASTSTATSRRAGRRRCAGRATIRCRSPRSTPSCGPSSPGPTSVATTRSTPAVACCCGRLPPSPTRPSHRRISGPGSSSEQSGRP